jgi:DNA-binding MarR family transcriptional regulator
MYRYLTYVASGLTKYQIKVLSNLAQHGPQHILSLQENTGLNYASTHRSVKTLEKYNQIWLQNKEPRGPKGAQTYSLTPYGIVELYQRGEKGQDTVIRRWEKITPKIIIKGEKIQQKIPLKAILDAIYPYVVQPYQTREKINWRQNLLTIHRNIIDTNFLNTLELRELEEIVDIIKQDQEFIEVWNHFFGIKQFQYQHLERLNEKIINIE